MLEKFVSRLDGIRVSPAQALIFIFAVGFVRYAEEWPIALSGATVPSQTLMMADYVTFYFSIFLLLLAGQKLILGKESYGPLLLGLFIALLPPAIDHFLYEHPAYSYPGMNLFFIDPVMTTGELSSIYLAIFAFGIYAFARSGKPVNLVAGALWGWATLQAVGPVHYFFASAVAGSASFAVFFSFFFALRLLSVPVLLAFLDPGFRGFLQYRASRIALFFGISLFSASLSGRFLLADLPVLAANLAAYILAFMLNNISDRREDAENKRPVFEINGLSWAFLAAMLGAAVLIGYVAGNPAFYIPVLVLAVSFLYSMGARLKRTFPLANISEAAVFALIFLSHALLRAPLNETAVLGAAICFAIFAIGGMVKDYKDVKGDKAAGISTIFTILDGNAAQNFWLVFRALLVLGPLFFIYLEAGSLSMPHFSAYGLYVLASGYVLFLAELAREQLVDYFIWVFSAFLLLSAFLP